MELYLILAEALSFVGGKMNNFRLNGFTWRIKCVDPYDSMLVDRTGQMRVATTDPMTQTVYISKGLDQDFRRRVMAHEISHCALISYGLLEEIHRMVYPEYWIEAEEWICNYISDYAPRILDITYHAIGDNEILFELRNKTA